MLVTHAQSAVAPLLGSVLSFRTLSGRASEFHRIRLLLIESYMEVRMTDGFVHYVAGLFDGEGFITINRWEHTRFNHIRFQLVVGINMTDPRALRKCRDRWGGYFHKGKRQTDKHKPLFAWGLGSGIAADFLSELEPLLNVKREEAVLAIEFQNHIRATNSMKFRTVHGYKSRSYPPEVFAKREDYRRRLHELKHVRHT